MKIINLKKLLGLLAACASAALAPAALGAPVKTCQAVIDTAALGGWVAYGDAQSYSLPVANYVATGSVSGPFTVKISDGSDRISLDGNVGLKRFPSGAIIDHSIPDNDVIGSFRFGSVGASQQKNQAGCKEEKTHKRS